MKIKELCEGERPREKMVFHGASALSNGELLAILLRNGLKGVSALELAQNLLSAAGGRLTRLFLLNMTELGKIPGIGTGKACSIMAALELGRRFMAEDKGVVKKPVISARMIFELMQPELKGADHEEFWVLYLTSALYLLEKEKVTTGSGNATTVDLRHIIKGALDRRAFAVAVVHNHPSGNPYPSTADTRHTKYLHEACKRFDITLIDHVIISDDSFYSMTDARKYEMGEGETSGR